MATSSATAATILPAGQASASEIIRGAIQRNEQIRARHDRAEVVFCPHALGERRGEPWVLGFTLVASPASPAPGSWEWFSLAGLQDVTAQPGVWLTAPRWSRPSAASFLATVAVEVP